MKRCPITYHSIPDHQDYSVEGWKLLDRKLQSLAPLLYTAEEQRQEAIARMGKMSIQGIQPKLSARLNIQKGCFDIVDCQGKFILKPPSVHFSELPENEDLTMRLAAVVGIEVPLHGLVYARDRSLTYFIKRFDYQGRKKVPLEDFAQLLGECRNTKYNFSMEKIVSIVERFCTFPSIEKVKLFERTLFNFLCGNEDMHLKNFSLISRNGRIDLAPAYDFINSTIALSRPQEELALSLRGKKSKITRQDFFQYFAQERLQINDQILREITERFQCAWKRWEELISISFLSAEKKQAYTEVLNARKSRMGF